MPDNVAEYELRYKIDQAEQALAKAQRDAAATEARIKDLTDAYQRGAVMGQEYASQIGALNAQLAQQRGAVEQLEAAYATQNAAVANASRATQQYIASTQGVGPAAQRAGSSGAYGILLLSQAVDDAQYGFRSIVNNIPQIGYAAASAFGASAETATKFGGALGLLAVAINQNLQHLAEWKALIADIGRTYQLSLGDLSKPFRELAEALNDVVYAGTEALGFGLKFDATTGAQIAAAKKAEQARVKEAEAAAKAIEGVTSKEQQDRAAAFRAAVQGEEGGGKGLRERLIAQQTAGLTQAELSKEIRLPGGTTKTRRAQIEENVSLQMEAALRGEGGAIGAVIAQQPGGEAGAFGRAYHEATPEFQARVKALEAENKAVAEAAQQQNAALDNNRKEDLKAHGAWLKEKADATAKALQTEIGGTILGRTAAGGVSPDDKFAMTETIRKRLSEAGYSEAQAREVSEAAYARIAGEAGGRVEAGVLKGKTRREAAQAALDEDVEKRGRGEQEKANRAQAEFNRRVAAAKEAAPGLSDLLSGQIEATAQLGGNVPAAQQALVRMLQGRVGADVAGKLVSEASADANRKLLSEALKEPQRRASEVIGSADFARAIQSGVGGADKESGRMTVEKLAELVNLTRQLVRKPGTNGVVLQR